MEMIDVSGYVAEEKVAIAQVDTLCLKNYMYVLLVILPEYRKQWG